MPNDEYGRSWSYRVITALDTEPGNPAGQRSLNIRMVWYRGRPELGDLDNIFAIEASPSVITGATIEELDVTLARMQRALDHPALIAAEWIGYFECEGSHNRGDAS